MENNCAESDPSPNWPDVVNGIAAGRAAALESLYELLKPIRPFLARQVGNQQVGDLYHETILDVIDQIRRGNPKQPECIISFARVIAARKVAHYIRSLTFCRSHLVEIDDRVAPGDAAPDPEAKVIAQQQQEIMLRLLGSLPRRDRDVLMRFYLYEQPAEQIQQELNLTETQFRLIKSRAKKRFTHLSQRRFAARSASLRATAPRVLEAVGSSPQPSGLPPKQTVQSLKKPIQSSSLSAPFRGHLGAVTPLLTANA